MKMIDKNTGDEEYILVDLVSYENLLINNFLLTELQREFIHDVDRYARALYKSDKIYYSAEVESKVIHGRKALKYLKDCVLKKGKK